MPRVIPIISVPNESKELMLQNIYLESHPNFDIFWYHWPKDGFVGVPDYEPIMIIYKNNGTDLCCVCPRRGWEYKPVLFEDLIPPIEIVFEGSFHHPFIRHKENTEKIESLRQNHTSHHHYNITRITKPTDIPIIARTGIGHPTLVKRLGWPVVDPFDKSLELHSEFCT